MIDEDHFLQALNYCMLLPGPEAQQLATYIGCDRACTVQGPVVPRAAQIDFKTLLVATDGSTHSEAAVKEALAIAKCSGSTLIALSSARDQSELSGAKILVNRVVESGGHEGVTVEAVTPVGRSYDAVVETAGGRGVDLVIMGSYGKEGLKKTLMGSSTEKVLGHVGCAVLIIKAK